MAEASKGTAKRERSCIACGAKAGKTSLLRIVRAPEGGISFDAGGRAPGRGAYVCSAACLAKAVSGKKLERALRCSVSKDESERIVAEVAAACSAAE